MDISPHLMQPLTINTNIVYDLDLSRFPGIDSIEHAHQPALLISTPECRQSWRNALEHQGHSGELETDVELESDDDLFQLIESIAEVGPTEDSGCIQDLIDDVIDSTSSSPDHVTSFLWNLSWSEPDDDVLLINFLSNEIMCNDSSVTPDLVVTLDMEATTEEVYPVEGHPSESTQETQKVKKSALKKRKRNDDIDESMAITFIGGLSCELEEYNRFG